MWHLTFDNSYHFTTSVQFLTIKKKTQESESNKQLPISIAWSPKHKNKKTVLVVLNAKKWRAPVRFDYFDVLTYVLTCLD